MRSSSSSNQSGVNYFFMAGILLIAFNCDVIMAKDQWLTSELQFDTRDFNTINFTGFSRLPKGASVWGFIDIEGQKFNDSRGSDFATTFLELDLRSPSFKHWGLIAELNALSDASNDLSRYGFYYNISSAFEVKNAFLFTKIFPLEDDGKGWQASFAWDFKSLNFLSNRLSMGGFLDLNFDSGTNEATHLVTETQVRYHLIEKLHFLVEYRRNNFFNKDRSGLGVGLKYHF